MSGFDKKLHKSCTSWPLVPDESICIVVACVYIGAGYLSGYRSPGGRGFYCGLVFEHPGDVLHVANGQRPTKYPDG